MLTAYNNQSITLKTRSSVNAYNEATYSSSTIKGRFEYNNKFVRNDKGEEIHSNATLYTEATVTNGDVITYDSRDWQVIDIVRNFNLDGAIEFYEVML